MSHRADDLRQYLHLCRASIITLGDRTTLHSSLSPPLAKASAGFFPPHHSGGGTVLEIAWSFDHAILVIWRRHGLEDCVVFRPRNFGYLAEAWIGGLCGLSTTRSSRFSHKF
jgi:hypothetical protein